jgi:hypothetical protein
MGHIAPEAAKRLVKNRLVEGIELDEGTELKSCNSCAHAKSTRKPIRKQRERLHNNNNKIISDNKREMEEGKTYRIRI